MTPGCRLGKGEEGGFKVRGGGGGGGLTFLGRTGESQREVLRATGDLVFQRQTTVTMEARISAAVITHQSRNKEELTAGHGDIKPREKRKRKHVR